MSNNLQQPSVGRVVHYMARGSADGVYPPVARAAIITEVGDTWDTIGVFVISPTGMFHRSLFEGGCAYDEDGAPGTWCWPARV